MSVMMLVLLILLLCSECDESGIALTLTPMLKVNRKKERKNLSANIPSRMDEIV